MKKVWDSKTRSYEYVQEGVWVDQQDYNMQQAYAKWASRSKPKAGRKRVVQDIIKKMIEDRETFFSHHKFIEKIESEIVNQNNSDVAAYLGKQNRKIPYSRIPAKHKPGIQDIVKGTSTFCRGKHTTRPSINAGVRDVKEYHLTSDQDGRATTGIHNGLLFVYYSMHHAAATYSYYLVTFKFNRVEVPLVGGKRDELIKWPF